MKLSTIFIGGLLFGIGLSLSKMTQQEVVLAFLQLQDARLLFVLGGAVVVTLFTYQFAPRLLTKPVLGTHFEEYKAMLSKRTIIGASIFGVGWGISGLCPGSALASLGTGNYPVLIGLLSMFLGAYVQGRFFPD